MCQSQRGFPNSYMLFRVKQRKQKSEQGLDLLLDQEKNFGAHAVDGAFCIMERIKE